MKSKLILLVLVLFAATSYGQKSQTAVLKDLNVDFMLRGYFYGGSRIEDKNALGGFGPSENFPKAVETSEGLPVNSVSLVALPNEQTVFANEFKGMRVLLINTTGAVVGFAASDSRLSIVQEALDRDGKWKAVEYLPSSWCGNSYHTVLLGPNEYWEFSAAKLNGKFKTRLRFTLTVLKDEKPDYIYSNEFDGSVNLKQFTVQQGHTPGSIMDPYNN